MKGTSLSEYLTIELEVPHHLVDKVLKGCPQMLGVSLIEQVRPMVQNLATRGLAARQLGKAATVWHMVLAHKTLANAASVLDFLHDAGVPRDKIAKVVVASPQLLALSVEKNLRPKVKKSPKCVECCVD